MGIFRPSLDGRARCGHALAPMGNTRFEGQPATTCPKCGERSPCVDWNEVDIGVGSQVFYQEYNCPTHGNFAFVFRNYQSHPVFRDDAERDTAKEIKS